jgi:hypothetical protein
MAEPLRHRQTKEAETDMPGLPPPRHIPTLPGYRLEWSGQFEYLERAKHPTFGATSTSSATCQLRLLHSAASLS